MKLLQWNKASDVPDSITLVCWCNVCSKETRLYLLKSLQCVRKAAAVKPDKELRFHPADKVVAASKSVKKLVLLHPEPIRVQVERKRCFCKTKTNNKMLLCEGCDEWYHHLCGHGRGGGTGGR